jgi:hypothetical protein
MALKRDLDVAPDGYAQPIWYMNEVAAVGGIVCISTGGSGAALDNQGTASSPIPLCTYKASSSGGIPLGLLMTEVVSLDTAKFHANFHKNQIAKPGKVTIVKRGIFHTNFYTGTTPTAGADAFLASSGYVQMQTTPGLANTPRIGKFWTTPSEDGYVKLEVNLPY